VAKRGGVGVFAAQADKTDCMIISITIRGRAGEAKRLVRQIPGDV